MILLDTHAWVWFVSNPELLSKPVRKAVNLPQPLHSDPADRIIIATAITIAAPVVTKDEKLLNYPHVKTIW